MTAYHRGRLTTEHGLSGGLMVATSLSLQQAERYILGTSIEIACDNSETSTTLSGERKISQYQNILRSSSDKSLL